MAKGKKARRKLSRELREAQAQHQKLLKRVEKARAKYEKRAAKLSVLEQQMADLEKRYYEPEAERLGQADAGKDAARPARLIFEAGTGANAEGSKELAELVKVLRGHGIAAQIDLTAGQSARELARAATDQGDELVIVAGGDQAVQDAARELIGTKTALAIVPGGAGQQIARALGIPTDLEPACALIGMGITRFVDAGEVIDGQGSRDYFLTSVVVGVNPGADSSLRMLKSYDLLPDHIEIELETGETFSPQPAALTVSNAPLVGPNGTLTPEAKLDDGLLEVGVYGGMSEQQVLEYLSRFSPSSTPDPNVHFYRARRVRVQASTSSDDAADSDGKLRQLEIKVLPQALAMIAGNGSALTLPVQAAQDVGAEGQGASNGKKAKPGLPIIGMFRNDPQDQA